MTMEPQTFNEAAWIAARRCFEASRSGVFDDQTNRALRRASTRFMALTFGMETRGHNLHSAPPAVGRGRD